MYKIQIIDVWFMFYVKKTAVQKNNDCERFSQNKK